MLVDAAARGRRYLWLYAVGLLGVLFFFEHAFPFVFIGLLLIMFSCSHFWVRRSSLPPWFKSRHLLYTVLSVSSFFVAYLAWRIAKSTAL